MRKTSRFNSIAAFVLVCFTAVSANSFADETFTFTYAFPAAPGNPDGFAVNASGKLTTTALDPATNTYRIINITGTRTANGATESITGLIPAGGFGNSNLLHAAPPWLDGEGLSFTVSNPNGGNDGHGRVNVYSIGSQYTENLTNVGNGAFTVTHDTIPKDGSLAIDVSSLTFTGQVGGAAPAPQEIHVTSNPSGTQFSVSVTSQGNWLDAGPTPTTTPEVITVSVNTGGLQAGTYTGTVTLSPSVGPSIDIPVTLNLTGGSALTVSVTQLEFYYQVGTSPPPSQTFNVTASTAPLSFNVAVATTEGTGWLSATPQTGTTPKSVTVSVQSNLPLGVYHGKVTISGGGGSVEIPVTFTVSSGTLLTVSAAPNPFIYQSGGSDPEPQTISIGSLGSTLSFTVATTTADGANWLSVTPQSGSTPQTLTITVRPSGLAPGSYTGKVVVTSTGASNSPLSIPVTLSVSNASTLVTSADSVVLNYHLGGMSEVLSQPITVASLGGPVTVAATTTVSGSASNCGTEWLQVFPNRISTPGIVNVALNPLGLTHPQSCIGTVVLSGGGAPVQITVTANVTTTPVFNAKPLSLYFTSAYQSPARPSQTIELSMTDNSAASFTATASFTAGSWLSVTPSSGSTPLSIVVSANPASLGIGSYTGAIKIKSPALLADLIVPVTFKVTPTAVSAKPASLSFVQTVGGPPPPTQNVVVAVEGGGQEFSVSIDRGSFPAAALTATPAGGNTPATISVAVQPNSLPAGTYTGSMIVAIPASAEGQIVIPITLTVTGSTNKPSISANPGSLAFTYPRGADPPVSQSISVTSNSGDSVNISATATTDSGGEWLALTPLSSKTPTSFGVSVKVAGLPDATYTGSVTLTPSLSGASPVTIPVRLDVTTPGSDTMRISGIANGASGARGAVAPGEIVTITGTLIGPTANATLTMTSDGKVATSLAGVRVFFDEFAAPLLYVSAGQINATVPYEVAGRATAQVRVQKDGVASDPYMIQISPTAPGIFTATQDGRGQAAALNDDNAANSQSSPANRGSIVQVFGTGEGITQPPGITGSVTDGLRVAVGKVSATVGGLPAEVVFAGAAPQAIAGLFQVNIRIPPNATTGDVPIAITVGEAKSQTGVTIAVK
jgi:uncharacterized protein (TIGR03437 family)